MRKIICRFANIEAIEEFNMEGIDVNTIEFDLYEEEATKVVDVHEPGSYEFHKIEFTVDGIDTEELTEIFEQKITEKTKSIWFPKLEKKPTPGMDELRKSHSDLVKSYSKMNKSELLEQICLEVIDLHKMEERVSVFMEHCTDGMSKTNYEPEAIKTLIDARHEKDISEFCNELLEDNPDDDSLITAIEDEAEKFTQK